MIVKTIIDEDFSHYKTCSMVVAFPTCSWKCNKCLCQNSELDATKGIEMPMNDILDRYMKNPISQAIVCAGLEPFDTFEDLVDLICTARNYTADPVVIYTGYDEKEIRSKIDYIAMRYENVIVKFGRYKPEQQPHFDKTLGVDLISDNQYARRIS